MKKLFVLIALLFVFLSLPAPSVQASAAEEGAPVYAVADSDSVWFYTEPNENSGLFLLPYTYYVLVLSEGANFCAVRYMDDTPPYKPITGYCKTDSITFVDFVPARPYLKREIKEVYALSLGSSAMGNGSFNTVEKTFYYYGMSYSGTSRYFYVLADGIFDFIPAAEPLIYELNTDYLPAAVVDPEPPEEEEAPVSPSSPTALQIVAICAVVVIAIGIALVILRGKKSHVQETDL